MPSILSFQSVADATVSALAAAVAYAGERQAFGKHLSEFQAVDTSAEEDQAEQEHRKDIGNAACAAWDEVARVKAEVEAEWLGEDEWDEDDEWYDENFHGG